MLSRWCRFNGLRNPPPHISHHSYLGSDEYKHGFVNPKTLSTARLRVYHTLSYQKLSTHLTALAGPYKTHCQLLPPGYLDTQTTTDWLPLPSRTAHAGPAPIKPTVSSCLQDIKIHRPLPTGFPYPCELNSRVSPAGSPLCWLFQGSFLLKNTKTGN